MYDFHSALQGLNHLLSDKGVVLLTVAGPSAHISRYDMDRWGDFWRFTDKSLALAVDRAGFLTLNSCCYGNPYTSSFQALGYSSDDYKSFQDISSHQDYQVLVAAVLVKK